MHTITVEPRDMKIKRDEIKKQGKIPAVFYGPKEKSKSVLISTSEFIKVYKKAGESSVVILKDGNEEHEALIHDMDIHPVTGAPRHVDFYVIEKGKKVKVNVPLVFDGISPAVKDMAAILVKVAREIEVEASPRDLPHEIHVDISTLANMDSVIKASDLKMPAGVTLISGEEEIIASVSEAKEESEEAPTPIDMSAIEVAKKGKEAKGTVEGEEGAEGVDQK